MGDLQPAVANSVRLHQGARCCDRWSTWSLGRRGKPGGDARRLSQNWIYGGRKPPRGRSGAFVSAETRRLLGNNGLVTLLDALRERSSEADLRRAIDALLQAMPVGRRVEITPEVLEAAAAGDVALLVTLFAEEIEPNEDELVALRELDKHPELRETIPLETVKAELGL